MPQKRLLTKAEAAKKAGISIRSLERYTAQGRVSVGYQTTKKGKQAVYEAADVERLRDELRAGVGAVVLPPERRETSRQPSTGESGEALARLDDLRPFLAQLVEAIAVRATAKPEEGPRRGPLSIGEKLAVTIPEAARLVGSSDRRIRAAIHAGELKAIKDTLGRGWRIRRRDLEEWLASL